MGGNNPRRVLKEPKGKQQRFESAASEDERRRALLQTGRQRTAGDSISWCQLPALSAPAPPARGRRRSPGSGGPQSPPGSGLSASAERERGAAGGHGQHRLRESGSAPSSAPSPTGCSPPAPSPTAPSCSASLHPSSPPRSLLPPLRAWQERSLPAAPGTFSAPRSNTAAGRAAPSRKTTGRGRGGDGEVMERRWGSDGEAMGR